MYRIWANFELFPKFMQHIRAVTLNPDGTWHWVMEGPLGMTLAWDAETTRMDVNQRIAWKSKPESEMQTSGQVTFAELPNNETEITVTLGYVPPAGAIGSAGAKIFDNPEQKLQQDLRNFKEYAESGAATVADRAQSDERKVSP